MMNGNSVSKLKSALEAVFDYDPSCCFSGQEETEEYHQAGRIWIERLREVLPPILTATEEATRVSLDEVIKQLRQVLLILSSSPVCPALLVTLPTTEPVLLASVLSCFVPNIRLQLEKILLNEPLLIAARNLSLRSARQLVLHGATQFPHWNLYHQYAINICSNLPTSWASDKSLLAVDEYGYSTLDLACCSRNLQFAQQLLCCPEVPFSYASILGLVRNYNELDRDSDELLSLLKKLLLRSPRIVDTRGNSILHLAAKLNRVELLKWLLQESELLDLACVNHKQETPLLTAAKHDSLGCALLLLERGASFASFDCSGRSPLYYACDNLNIHLIEKLLDVGASLTCVECVNKQTPLAVICQKCSVTMSSSVCYILQEVYHKYPIETAAVLCSKDARGHTPGYYMIVGGSESFLLNIFKILPIDLLFQSYPDNATHKGILYTLAARGYQKLLSVVFTASTSFCNSTAPILNCEKLLYKNRTLVHLVAKYGLAELLGLMNSHFVTFSTSSFFSYAKEDKVGKCSLQLAIEGDHVNVATQIIPSFTESELVVLRDSKQRCLLHSVKSLEMLKLLESVCSKSAISQMLTSRDIYLATPLFYACQHRSPTSLLSSSCLTEHFLAYHCTVVTRDIFSKTPLHCATIKKCSRCVKLLLDSVESVSNFIDLRDRSDNTATHLAAYCYDEEILIHLLVYHPNLDLINNVGQTARELLTASGDPRHLLSQSSV